MALEVIDVSGLATIQDSGRKGWRRFGVPASGPMDGFAFQAANRLAGNPIESAAFEVGLGDATFQALHDCVIAVTGAGYTLSIFAWDFPLWGSFFVRAGWMIRLNKVDSGMWCYLAVTGGFLTKPMLDSRSTNLRGRFGGFDGRPLQTGDIVPTVHHPSSHEFVPRTLSQDARPSYGDNPIVNVIM